MIKCHLSTLMGRERMNIADVIRQTGLSRNAVSALYDERAKRVDINTIEKLCELFSCTVNDLFEYVPSGKKE